MGLFLVLAAVACSDDGAESTTSSVPEIDTDGPPTTPAGDGTDTTLTEGDPTLAPNMVRIEGSITSGRADAAADGAIAGPFTLHVPSRGGGNGAVFNPVTVDGTHGSVVWDGGRPLSLEGPALAFDGGWILDGGVLAFDLASGAVALEPGTYSLVGPVAVGDSSGLARPADAVSFVSGADSTILGTGHSTIQVDAPTVLLGPGAFEATGTFTVTSAQETTSATTISVTNGSFEMTVSPTDDGTLQVSGLAQGAQWS